MIFFVIGNGFDLHYGLHTAYHHFKRHLIDKGYGELVKKVDRLFYERGNFSPEDIIDWSKFEDMLVVFNHLYADEIYEEAMSNAENDDERADYFDSPSWNVNYYNDYIQVLKQQFALWVKHLDTHITQDQYFQPQAGDLVLTFNYTTTIEDNFFPVDFEIVHIHGTIGQEIVLGHNDYQEPDHFAIVEDEASDYRETTTQKAVNSILAFAANQYYKNSKSILSVYSDIFSRIPRFDKVVIMGLSCGLQDEEYIREIIKYSKYIEFYYHSDKTKQVFENYAHENDICVNYIPW